MTLAASKEMTLTKEQINLLRRLRELPQNKRVSMGGVPPRYKELIEAGYVTTQLPNVSDLLLEITDKGRQAITLAEAKRQ